MQGGGQCAHEQGLVRGVDAVFAIVALYPAGHRLVIQRGSQYGLACVVQRQQGLQVFAHHRQQHGLAGQLGQVIGIGNERQHAASLRRAQAAGEVALYQIIVPWQQGDAAVIISGHMVAATGSKKAVLRLHISKIMAAAADNCLGRAGVLGTRGAALDHFEELLKHFLQHQGIVFEQLIEPVKYKNQAPRARIGHQRRYVSHGLHQHPVAPLEYQHQHFL